MSHDLEIDEKTGEAAFFAARDLNQSGERQLPWHKLGVVTDGALDAATALSTARLNDWNVRLVPDVAVIEGGFYTTEGASRVVRTNPFTGAPQVLSWVSDSYSIVQNEDMFAFLDTFGELGGAKFETAGSLSDGRRVFVTMRMPQELLVAGMDPVETYILFTSTHDGNGSAEGLIVPNRVVCRNTLDLAMGNQIRRVRIRHTGQAVNRLQQAAEILSATEGYVGSFKKACEHLAAQKMVMREVDAFLEQLFPLESSPSKQAVTQAANKREAVRALVKNSNTIQDEFRMTGWGVLNAAVEWYDFMSPVRGAEDDDARRAYRTTIGSEGSDFKSKARKLLLAV